MKLYNKLTFVLLSVLSLLGLFSCQKSKDGEQLSEKNTAYIAETGMRSNTRRILLIDKDPITGSFTPRLSSPQDKDVRLTVEVDEEGLKGFNEDNGTAYVVLPSDSYNITSREVVIPAGMVAPVTPVTFDVSPLTQELMNSGNSFAIPFKIKSDCCTIIPVQGADRIVYAVDFVRYPKVPIIGNSPKGYMKGLADFEKYPLEFDEITIEFRLRMSSFAINNQAIFSGIGGPEIYVRYGDAPIPYNQLQVKFAGGQVNSFQAQRDKWHHIALVYNKTDLIIYLNGEEKSKLSNAGQHFKLAGKMAIAGSGLQYFRAQAMFSEYRIWNVARSQAEIKSNFYGVNPKTPGLVSYWKLDEGEGTTAKNSVEGAPDMHFVDGYDKPVSAVEWVEVKAINEDF